MSKMVFEALGRSYEFDNHRIGYGGERVFAVNVKCHRWPKLAAGYPEKVEQLRDLGIDAEKLCERAREDTAQFFWEQAAEDSVSAGLGPCHSEGRSGGWLVLSEMTRSKLEELAEENEERCAHCDQDECEHAGFDRQCLFAATYYKAELKHGRSAQEKLDALVAYETSIKSMCEGSFLEWEERWHQEIDDALEQALAKENADDEEAVGSVLHGDCDGGLSTGNV